MKRIVFLIIASLLVLGLVLPGCGEPAGPEITIAIAGPMKYVQGKHMWNGAEMASDEINDAGGVTVGGTTYYIKLIEVDTHDFSDDPVEAMNYAIDNGAQFIIGGYRADEVAQMIPVAMSNHIPFFIDGDATYSQLSGITPYPNGTGTPYYPYEANSAGYKYIFRGAPFNDFVFPQNNCFLMATMVAKRIEGIITASDTNPVKIAIFAESLPWADAMVASAQTIFGTVAPSMFGWPWELVGTWRVTDTESYANVQTKLNEIKAAGAQVIFTIMSGPVGLTYGKAMGAVGVPAVSVGINVEAQDPGYWLGTEWESGKYGAESEITMGTWWVSGVNQTDQTADFLANYAAYTGGLFPVYTAASYDIVYTLKLAIEEEDSLAADDIVEWLEDPANAPTTTSGTAAHYPVWDGSTTGMWRGVAGTWPALNSTQIDQIYGTIGYNASCDFTMPPYTTHDLIYGPGYVTGLAVQWQNVTGTGTQAGVWPNSGNWSDQNTMSRYFIGINWTNIQYEGITDFKIPTWMCQAWGYSC